MATRFYVTTTTPDISPSYVGWEVTSTAVRVDAVIAGATNSSNSIVGTPDGTNPNDVLLLQGVSAPIKAQTLSPAGAWTVKGQIRCHEQAGGSSTNARSQLKVYVVDSAGSVRGTLLDFSAAALSSEWTTSSTNTNRKVPLAGISPAALTQVVASDGDRIVFEVGARCHGTITTANAVQMLRTGGKAANLLEDETSTLLSNTWWEFSGNIAWLVEPTTTALGTSTFAPTVTVSDHKSVIPGTASLSLASFAPDVTTAAGGISVTPSTVALVTSTFIPTVTATAHISVTPTTASLGTSTSAPSVSASAHVTLTPDWAVLALATFAPTVTGGAGLTLTPTTATLVATLLSPEVAATAHQLMTPTTAQLSTLGYSPTVMGDVVPPQQGRPIARSDVTPAPRWALPRTHTNVTW